MLDFPDGLDPDEFIRRDGPEAFAKLPALTAETYRIRRLRAEADFSTEQGKADFARKAVSLLTPLDPVEREGYLKQLCVATGFSREVLDAQMAEELKKAGKAVPKAPAAKREDPARTLGISGEGGNGGARRAGTGNRPALSEEEWEVLRAQEMLIGLMATGRLPEGMAHAEDFAGSGLQQVYQDLQSGALPAALIDREEDEESRSRLTRLLLSPAAAGSTDEMIAMAQDCVKQIRRGRVRQQMQEIEGRMANCNGETLNDLMKEYQKLSEQMRRMT